MTVQLPQHPNALRLVASTLARSIRPPRRVPFPQWLTENIVLVDGPRAGQLWDPAGAPYLVEPAKCLGDDHPCNRVTIRKSQQSGASILAMAWCLYIADREPANVLYAAPNLEALRELNSQKLQPLIDAWQRRTRRVVILPQTSRNGQGSTTYEKKFAGGYIALANSNSVTDLSSKTVRKGVKDELSKWQETPDAQDPEDLFFGRFTAYRRMKDYKILEISTPEVDSGVDFDPETGEILGDAAGHCRIDLAFQKSDRRFWNCICPACRQPFVHSIDRLRIDQRHPHKSTYEHECGHLISEPERVVAVRAGHWRPTMTGEGRHPGFHIDAFISLMMSYEAIAEDSLAARSEIQKKGLHNLVLALTYKYKGDAPEWKTLLDRIEPELKRGHVPPRGLLLTAFCDVQMRGMWLEIVAHAPDRQSWCVDALYIEGDTSDPNGPAFQQLRKETLDREFPDAFGRMRRIDALGIDSGYRANVVYAWVRNTQRQHPDSGRDLILATKGLKGWSRPALGQPSLQDIDLGGRKVAQGAKVWGVGTWPLKVTLYADLRQQLPDAKGAPPVAPSGYCHFGSWCDENYFKQLTAEVLEDIKSHGRTTGRRWAKTRDNHFHDCRVGNIALADYLGINSTTPEQWAQLAAARGLPPELSEATLFTPRSAPVHDTKDAQGVVDRGRDAAKADRERRSHQAPAWASADRPRNSWGRR